MEETKAPRAKRPPKTDRVDDVLRLLTGLADRGVVPLSVEVSDSGVRVQVARVAGRDNPPPQTESAPARSYLGQARSTK